MKARYLSIVEVLFITILACIPLFSTFPYRVNIFLSWEGAYRLSQGQLPFRDFGTPLGGMYWVIPALFFKLFGAQMITLIKAQVFINIVAGLSFRSILKSLQVQSGIRFISILLFCISYSFFNFWPWYNHSVIVYELVALAFLFRFIFNDNARYRVLWLILSSIFTCFSVLTKQDGGGMAFLICFVLLLYNCFVEKRWKHLLLYTGAFIICLCSIILPLSKFGFGYWFNHGQPPHTARISAFEIIDEFFANSQWIKLYIFLILIGVTATFKKWRELLYNKREIAFFLLTIAILAEAAIFQVTSYTPPDNNIFFHSFAVAFLLHLLYQAGIINFERSNILIAGILGILLWWSGTYWKYIQRVAARTFPENQEKVSATGENIVNRKTYMINMDTTDATDNNWGYCGLNSFNKIYMPASTVDGIHRLMNMDIVKQQKNIKVLNMSELTPLAAEIPYTLESNPELPLWYHLGVGMFNKQARLFEGRISQHYYDLVLFEYMPGLNNFYPFCVRDSLKAHYRLVDTFAAPRRGDAKSQIEVYLP